MLNTSGSVVRSSTITTASGAEFPNISGNNDKVYISYRAGSNIVTKKSTNAGSSWSTLDNIGLGSDACNGVDIAYGNGGLHIVWGKDVSGNNYSETYYYKFRDSDDEPVEFKQVTDYSGEVGGFPSITLSGNKAHLAYNSAAIDGYLIGNQGTAKTKDKDLSTNTWQNPQAVFTSPDGYSSIEVIFANGNYVYNFYTEFVSGLGQFHNDLYVKKRGVNRYVVYQKGISTKQIKYRQYDADPLAPQNPVPHGLLLRS